MLGLVTVLTASIPLVIVGVATFACNIPSDAGKKVAFRPPAYAFSFLWPLLLLLLGCALQRADTKWPLALLPLGLALWMLAYSSACGATKKEACWVLVADVWLALVSLGFATMEGRAFNACVSGAFVAWLSFALLMNAVEVQTDSYPCVEAS